MGYQKILVGDGQELKLTPCEFQLLKVLDAHPNRVFSRTELLNLVQVTILKGMNAPSKLTSRTCARRSPSSSPTVSW